jgi:hypothetical protein
MILGMILFVDNATTAGVNAPAAATAATEAKPGLGDNAASSGSVGVWREGVAGGVELLDNVGGAGADVAQRAVRVLREILVRVDTAATVDAKPSVITPPPCQGKGN